jgi:hypothetical protein
MSRVPDLQSCICRLESALNAAVTSRTIPDRKTDISLLDTTLPCD